MKYLFLLFLPSISIASLHKNQLVTMTKKWCKSHKDDFEYPCNGEIGIINDKYDRSENDKVVTYYEVNFENFNLVIRENDVRVDSKK